MSGPNPDVQPAGGPPAGALHGCLDESARQAAADQLDQEELQRVQPRADRPEVVTSAAAERPAAAEMLVALAALVR